MVGSVAHLIAKDPGGLLAMFPVFAGPATWHAPDGGFVGLVGRVEEKE